MTNKIYPNTPVRWPSEGDAPGDESVIEHAHVVLAGDRVSVRKREEDGRYQTVDTLIDATVKGSGKNTSVTGKSLFMIDRIGLDAEEAEVTLVFDGSLHLCLNC
jgi:hypothetical protein